MKKYLDRLAKVQPRMYAGIAAALLAGGAGVGDQLSKRQVTEVSKQVAPTLSQRDNKFQPHRTCNTSSNAMYLQFYAQLIPERAGQVIDDDDFLDSVMKRGDTTVHDVQTRSLKAWGLNSNWNTDRNMTRVKKMTTEGMPTVVNILHRGVVNGKGARALRGGHVIVLRYYDANTKKFTVADPYGSLASGYRNTGIEAGNYEITEAEFRSRWQGGYRTLSNTQASKLGLNNQ